MNLEWDSNSRLTISGRIVLPTELSRATLLHGKFQPNQDIHYLQQRCPNFNEPRTFRGCTRYAVHDILTNKWLHTVWTALIY